MLKYIKHHMETILGIEVFPLISFIIFFTFFLLVTFMVIAMKKRDVDYMSQMPLEDDPNDFSGK